MHLILTASIGTLKEPLPPSRTGLQVIFQLAYLGKLSPVCPPPFRAAATSAGLSTQAVYTALHIHLTPLCLARILFSD